MNAGAAHMRIRVIEISDFDIIEGTLETHGNPWEPRHRPRLGNIAFGRIQPEMRNDP
jgi:hypothetical protein